jgi:hypothetical protein
VAAWQPSAAYTVGLEEEVLELEEGYAPRELVHARKHSPNRFLAARDGVAAALIDPRARAGGGPPGGARRRQGEIPGLVSALARRSTTPTAGHRAV